MEINPGTTLFPGATFYGNPSVYSRILPPIEGVRMTLVRAVDNLGREVKIEIAGQPNLRTTEQYVSARKDVRSWESYAPNFGMATEMYVSVLKEIPEGARSLDLTFAIQKNPVVSFVVKPQRLGP